jgi:hypothetical protein
MRWYLLIVLVMGGGCSPPKSIPGVVRPGPGEPLLEKLPGPMPDFGPFDSYSDAVMAACPLILSKPNATAGRVGSQDFQLRWRISSEYCAWLYYTPDHKYEMSMLTDQHRPDPGNNKKTCLLPPVVDDPRYPPDSLKYIFALHNHPYTDKLSKYDVNTIVNLGMIHGFESETGTGKIRLAIIAFFSNSDDFEHPSCDGFFEFIPMTSEMLKWTHSQGRWHMNRVGTASWSDDAGYHLEEG